MPPRQLATLATLATLGLSHMRKNLPLEFFWKAGGKGSQPPQGSHRPAKSKRHQSPSGPILSAAVDGEFEPVGDRVFMLFQPHAEASWYNIDDSSNMVSSVSESRRVQHR